MVKLDKDTFVAGVWTAPFNGGDYFAILYRPKNEPWKASYRFRYYDLADRKVFDSKDKKNWYSLSISGSHTMTELESTLTGLLREVFPNVIYTVINDFPSDKMMDILVAHPMMYFREETP